MNISGNITDLIKSFVNQNLIAKKQRTKLLIEFKLWLIYNSENLNVILQATKGKRGEFQLTKAYHGNNKDLNGETTLSISTSIILYISVWCIYIQQSIIKQSDIRNNFNFTNAYNILKPALHYYLNNKQSIYYFDAKKCKNFLKNKPIINNERKED